MFFYRVLLSSLPRYVNLFRAYNRCTVEHATFGCQAIATLPLDCATHQFGGTNRQRPAPPRAHISLLKTSRTGHLVLLLSRFIAAAAAAQARGRTVTRGVNTYPSTYSTTGIYLSWLDPSNSAHTHTQAHVQAHAADPSELLALEPPPPPPAAFSLHPDCAVLLPPAAPIGKASTESGLPRRLRSQCLRPDHQKRVTPYLTATAGQARARNATQPNC